MSTNEERDQDQPRVDPPPGWVAAIRAGPDPEKPIMSRTTRKLCGTESDRFGVKCEMTTETTTRSQQPSARGRHSWTENLSRSFQPTDELKRLLDAGITIPTAHSTMVLRAIAASEQQAEPARDRK